MKKTYEKKTKVYKVDEALIEQKFVFLKDGGQATGPIRMTRSKLDGNPKDGSDIYVPVEDIVYAGRMAKAPSKRTMRKLGVPVKKGIPFRYFSSKKGLVQAFEAVRLKDIPKFKKLFRNPYFDEWVRKDFLLNVSLGLSQGNDCWTKEVTGDGYVKAEELDPRLGLGVVNTFNTLSISINVANEEDGETAASRVVSFIANLPNKVSELVKEDKLCLCQA